MLPLIKWYELTEQKLYTVLAQSNFYAQMAQVYEDEITFGTSCLLTLEDVEDALLVRFYVPCAGENHLANGARFSVNTFMREFTLTVAAQILETCSASTTVPSRCQVSPGVRRLSGALGSHRVRHLPLHRAELRPGRPQERQGCCLARVSLPGARCIGSRATVRTGR